MVLDYQQTTQELINYYVNLLIIQYHDQAKAKATIAALIKGSLANCALMQVRDSFDWRTAKGPQLDRIGAWVGVDRFYDGRIFDFRPWFAIPGWNDTTNTLQGGFSEFSNFEELGGGFLEYDSVNPSKNQMIDAAFRLMIGLKIIKNSINHTAKNIDNAIWDYFGGDVYTTWSGKTLTYHYKSELREVLVVGQNKKVLPKPTGVQIELMEITR